MRRENISGEKWEEGSEGGKWGGVSDWGISEWRKGIRGEGLRGWSEGDDEVGKKGDRQEGGKGESKERMSKRERDQGREDEERRNKDKRRKETNEERKEGWTIPYSAHTHSFVQVYALHVWLLLFYLHIQCNVDQSEPTTVQRWEKHGKTSIRLMKLTSYS